MSVVAFPTPAPFRTQADQPMRVLREDLSARIAVVNNLRNLLKACDIKVASQDLINEGGRPLLVLVRGDQRLRGVATSVRQTGKTITAVIDGVDVRWPHEASA